jgi:hypothetical protein
MTKTKKLTVNQMLKAGELYEQIINHKFGICKCGCYSSECGCGYGKKDFMELKNRFRKVLGLPMEFRLTEHRLRLLDEDFYELAWNSISVRKLSVEMLMDTLAVHKFPTPYANRLSKTL